MEKPILVIRDILLPYFPVIVIVLLSFYLLNFLFDKLDKFEENMELKLKKYKE